MDTRTLEPAGLTSDGFQSEWPTQPAGPPPQRPSRLGFFHELPVLIAVAFTLALLMKTFLVQAFFIPSESMVPTLQIGDRVIVNKLAYRFREPARGEVIVFVAQRDTEERSLFGKIRSVLFEGLGVTRPKETDFIKRVVGLPGDTIEVNSQGVFITPEGGERTKLDEPYIASPDEQGGGQPPTIVPEDTYFVMGDNRDASADSRARGVIKREDIIGKAFIKIWPVGRIDLMDVPAYTGPVAADDGGGTERALVPAGLLAIGAVRARRRAARPAPGLAGR